MTEASHPILSVEGLTKTFDVSLPWLDRVIAAIPRRRFAAVSDVTFAIQRAETFGLVGESGSGKSTLARLITGLISPDNGRVCFDGTPLPPLGAPGSSRARRPLTMIFQDPTASLNPRMSAWSIIAEPLWARAPGLTRSEVDGRVAVLLGEVGLSDRDGGKYPHEFSGGQRQRIAIARALASDPQVIICDEPTSALDVSVQAQVLNLMRDLQGRLGLSYLFISHNLAVVRHMSSKVGVMYLGRLVEVAPAEDLFVRPRHPYTRMLIAAVPSMAPQRRGKQVVMGEIANPLSPPPGCPFHPRCPIARARCRNEVPALRTFGSARVACHEAEA